VNFKQRPRGGWWLKSVLLAIAVISSAAPAYTQNLKVTLLGTGYPRPVMERFGPSILVSGHFGKRDFELRKTLMFLTHLHSDHIVGIPDFYLTGWIFGRSTPLRVWGPAGTAEMMSHLEQACQFDIHVRRDVDEKLPAQGVVIAAKDIEPGVVYQNGDLKVTAFTVDHAPIKPAFGYRVDYAGTLCSALRGYQIQRESDPVLSGDGCIGSRGPRS
jgi:ribonuclease Z